MQSSDALQHAHGLPRKRSSSHSNISDVRYETSGRSKLVQILVTFICYFEMYCAMWPRFVQFSYFPTRSQPFRATNILPQQHQRCQLRHKSTSQTPPNPPKLFICLLYNILKCITQFCNVLGSSDALQHAHGVLGRRTSSHSNNSGVRWEPSRQTKLVQIAQHF